MRANDFWAGFATSTLIGFACYGILNTDGEAKKYWEKLQSIKIGDEIKITKDTYLPDVPIIRTKGSLTGSVYRSDDRINCRLDPDAYLAVVGKGYFFFTNVLYLKPSFKDTGFVDIQECVHGVVYSLTKWKYLELVEENKEK